MPEYFAGAEFEWLEKQVRAACWWPGTPGKPGPMFDQLYGMGKPVTVAPPMPPKSPMAYLEYDPAQGAYDITTGQWLVRPKGEYVNKNTSAY